MIKRTPSLISALSLILAFGTLAACSHDVDLTYQCTPSGATVFEEGIGVVGTCPITLVYSPYDQRIDDGKVNTGRIRVQWMSGATLAVPASSLEIVDHKASMTFVHPPNTLNDGHDRTFGALYDEKLLPIPERHVATAGESKDIFDSMNNTFTCSFETIIGSIDRRCE